MATLQVARSAAVCTSARLEGTVTVGEQCAVHPGAALRAIDGPITLGTRCFVEDGADLAAIGGAMTVGSSNLFESGCVVHSSSIGDGNWFEPRSEARPGSVVGSNCLIGAGVVVKEGETVPDNSILVAVQTPKGQIRRVVRPQKDYLVKTHAGTIQKYVDIFTRGAKSPHALEKHHELLQ